MPQEYGLKSGCLGQTYAKLGWGGMPREGEGAARSAAIAVIAVIAVIARESEEQDHSTQGTGRGESSDSVIEPWG